MGLSSNHQPYHSVTKSGELSMTPRNACAVTSIYPFSRHSATAIVAATPQ
jgi:hypothetical protein